jgi:hypothetical protein
MPAAAPYTARFMAAWNCLPVIDSWLQMNPPMNMPARAPSRTSVSNPLPVTPDTDRIKAQAAEPPSAPAAP